MSKRDTRQKLAEVGIQPRGLSSEGASAYVGVSVNEFKRLVKIGVMPGPKPWPMHRKIYDRQAIDACFGLMAPPPTAQAEDPVMQAIERISTGRLSRKSV